MWQQLKFRFTTSYQHCHVLFFFSLFRITQWALCALQLCKRFPLELASILAERRWECILFREVSMAIMRPKATSGKGGRLEKMETRERARWKGAGLVMPGRMSHRGVGLEEEMNEGGSERWVGIGGRTVEGQPTWTLLYFHHAACSETWWSYRTGRNGCRDSLIILHWC